MTIPRLYVKQIEFNTHLLLSAVEKENWTEAHWLVQAIITQAKELEKVLASKGEKSENSLAV